MTVHLPPDSWSTATGVLISASSTSAAPCKGACIQDSPHRILGAIFQQDNARPHVAKTVRDFCSAQLTQFLLWPAYSPVMSPIEHVCNLVGRRLARDLRPAASKDELLLRIQAIWNSLPQADIQNLFYSMPRCIAVLIAARGVYTKY
ncbi:hypothetical protein TNCV_344791 [Trichonephila clavipes]|nr:hypothetical protein TNCV_344791 [Trichonephila clavipes]